MIDSTMNALRTAMERMERETETRFQELVGSEAFSETLAQSMGVFVGMVRMRNDAFEQALRTMRVPSQSDVARLARQINRLDDKVEDLLAALERLEERLDAQEPAPAPAPRRTRAAAGAGQ